jgi:hypothetical protein
VAREWVVPGFVLPSTLTSLFLSFSPQGPSSGPSALINSGFSASQHLAVSFLTFVFIMSFTATFGIVDWMFVRNN